MWAKSARASLFFTAVFNGNLQGSLKEHHFAPFALRHKQFLVFQDISSRSSPKSAFDQSPARRGNLKFSLPFGDGDMRLSSSRPIILNQSDQMGYKSQSVNQMFLLIASPGSVRPRQQQQTDRRRSVSTSLWKGLAHVT